MPHVRFIIADRGVRPRVCGCSSRSRRTGNSCRARSREKRRAIAAKKQRERVLTSTIEGYSRRIDVLEGDIAKLRERPKR